MTLSLKKVVLALLVVVIGIAITTEFARAYKMCDRKCSPETNLFCPSNEVCQPIGHCDIDVPHKYTTTDGLRSCITSKNDECTVSDLWACSYDHYQSSDTSCTNRIGTKSDAACYDICGT